MSLWLSHYNKINQRWISPLAPLGAVKQMPQCLDATWVTMCLQVKLEKSVEGRENVILTIPSNKMQL